MRVRSLSVKLCLATGLLLLPAGTNRADDGNAVGGSARDAVSKAPLDNVTVTVVQDSAVHDSSRSEDGAYILKVPSALKAFDILYKKTGYLDVVDLDVPNDTPQQKRPIARMVRAAQIKNLSADELKELVGAAKNSIERAKEVKGKAGDILLESSRGNLRIIRARAKSDDPIKNRIGDLLDRADEVGKLIHKP